MPDINNLQRWIKEHPVAANFYVIGIAILILELVVLLEQLGKYLDRLKGV